MTTKKGGTTKNKTVKKNGARKRATKKPTTEELLVVLRANVAELKTLLEATNAPAPVTPAAQTPPTVKTVELRLSPESSWATKRDMPTFPEVKRMLLAGVAGKLHPDEEELAYLVRELSASQCLLCGKDSHPSVAPGTPWEKVQLCGCKFMRGRKGREGKEFQRARVPASSPQTRPLLEGWALARSATDGGIEWLRTEMQAGRVHPGQAVYAGLCRCGKEFPIYAGMIARAVQDYGLKVYVESKKCFTCAKKAAAWRAANNTLSKGVTPEKVSQQPAQTGFASLREVMPPEMFNVVDPAQQNGAA
jgi:hypothetical protein